MDFQDQDKAQEHDDVAPAFAVTSDIPLLPNFSHVESGNSGNSQELASASTAIAQSRRTLLTL